MPHSEFTQPSLYLCLALVAALAAVSVVLETMTPATAGGFGLITVLVVSQITVVRHRRREPPGHG
ncbi:hypothetical protein ACFQZ2_03765 [Streptomonospora algeriensis]|uniref:Uncharacterized protein n=1 Tax=Streptomonospora algeriensis TaxID=995084 RepID=A0ABW3BFT0_9ACTN